MKVSLMPLYRQLKFRKWPYDININCTLCNDHKNVYVTSINTLCRKLNCHPQDVVWTQTYKPLPKKRTIAPMLKELERRKLSLYVLLNKMKPTSFSSTMVAVRNCNLPDYFIYSAAYLLDMEPEELIEEIKE